MWFTAPMTPVGAVLFDYGDTLCALGVAQERMGEAYAEIRTLLADETGREIPPIPELVKALTVRVIGLVGASYKRREVDEQDMVTLFDEALKELDLDVSRATVETICGLEYRAMVSERTVPQENLDALDAMRRRGLKLGIVSNVHFIPGLMLEHLETLGLTERMDVIVTSAGFGLRKPHPDIYTNALEQLGVGADATLFVGDKIPEDVGGPHQLGMRAALTHQFRQEEVDGASDQPDLVINTLSDLLPWLDEVGVA